MGWPSTDGVMTWGIVDDQTIMFMVLVLIACIVTIIWEVRRLRAQAKERAIREKIARQEADDRGDIPLKPLPSVNTSEGMHGVAGTPTPTPEQLEGDAHVRGWNPRLNAPHTNAWNPHTHGGGVPPPTYKPLEDL